MAMYGVTHLATGKTYQRPYALLNPHSKNTATKVTSDPGVEAFHRGLPGYGETRLHSLSDVAKELGLAAVFIKDESTRFGLPSFKILGASWAIYRAVCKRLGLSADPAKTSLEDVKLAAQASTGLPVQLVTCSEGNWGRACARMAKYLSIPCILYVPSYMNDYTQSLIRGEGAEIRVVTEGHGSYDDAIAAARKAADGTNSLLVMDTSWEGYEEVPGWVTQGYSTMLAETDRQVAAATGGKSPTLAICSVGVGSWAHAVAAHYGATHTASQVVTAEPDTAASLKEALHNGDIVTINTGDTIMCGMNCGTTSKIAWPVLRDGTYAAVAVTDLESHENVQYLQSHEINAGPCGAATLAALKRLCNESELLPIDKRKETIVVLFSTEGTREYMGPTGS